MTSPEQRQPRQPEPLSDQPPQVRLHRSRDGLLVDARGVAERAGNLVAQGGGVGGGNRRVEQLCFEIEQLLELERALIDSAMASADVEAMRQEIAASLGDTSRLDEKTVARTVEANLRRVVRERFGLPRLTLF